MLLELQSSYPKLKMGNYYHFVSSLHIYERNYKIMDNIYKHSKKERKIMMPRMRILSEIKRLQYNEEIIRTGSKRKMKNLKDQFCIWCQEQLMEKKHEGNNH
ncbi:MAG: hypothetical protein COT24_00590 [Candidatus Kerfeldbacteria bacterium CG08_land_8_20_14_0_20_40_16]|uniref:Thymidylate synthase/dCMP hydroxymethylase domain-containing protein n=1 Tax=Candidatus Kerfeldbacteria bacterium CG08_land_8_20_14_0_20_40_16 TaxID=2014244 RepID=A0A2H0YZ53_9BACT|nr:MAG: hypothetical protein COT24_00590 [Candidatus Kerfeldbacteria bacterium CG08_land_8_20_14_0_20_40_16]